MRLWITLGLLVCSLIAVDATAKAANKDIPDNASSATRHTLRLEAMPAFIPTFGLLPDHEVIRLDQLATAWEFNLSSSFSLLLGGTYTPRIKLPFALLVDVFAPDADKSRLKSLDDKSITGNGMALYVELFLNILGIDWGLGLEHSRYRLAITRAEMVTKILSLRLTVRRDFQFTRHVGASLGLKVMPSLVYAIDTRVITPRTGVVMGRITSSLENWLRGYTDEMLNSPLAIFAPFVSLHISI